MKKNEIWLQLHNESNKNYERFRKFLDFDGSLDEFVSACCSDVSYRTIVDCSAKYKWLKRKKAYRNKHRQIVEKARDKVIGQMAAKHTRDIFVQYENCMRLLLNKAEKYLSNFDDLIKTMPPHRAISFLSSMPAAMKQMNELKAQMVSESDMQCPVSISYVSDCDFSKIDVSEFQLPEEVVGESNPK